MGIPHFPGELERLIGVFYRVNAKRPPRKPEYNPKEPLVRLAITQGLMQMTVGTQEVHVEIPHDQRVDRDTYLGVVGILTQSVVQFFQVPHYQAMIDQALRHGGIIAEMDNGVLRISPLKASTSLSDAF